MPGSSHRLRPIRLGTAAASSTGEVTFVEAHLRPYTPTMDHTPPVGTEVLIPIKAFADAKRRLARELGPEQREQLARAMAARVISAAAPLSVSVVCDDDEVAAFAASHGANVIWCPARGLNAAVTEGVAQLRDREVTEVVVSHADLPFAESFDSLIGWRGITLVPDRHMRGTNVAVVPTDPSFNWSYGNGSLNRHRAECLRLGLPLRIQRVDTLSWDVDIPADLLVGPARSLTSDLIGHAAF